MNPEKNDKKKKGGFTLIELLLGITLSAILMTGIVVFVSSSLGSNITTKKILEEGNKNEDFTLRFVEAIGNITGSGLYATGSSFGGSYLTGMFLSTSGPNLPLTFLGLKTQTGYCDSYSGTASETGTIMKLALRQFSVPAGENSTSYTLSSTGNAVFSGTVRIIGTLYPGNALSASGIDTELSLPSALVSSGIHLYIADTMNDRVLSYDMTNGGIIQLLGRENGIEKPTSLYFSGNILLVASSGNGKIYSLQDGNSGNGATFMSSFKISKPFMSNIIKFTFPGIPSVLSPTTAGDFTLDGISQDVFEDFVSTGASLQYTLSGGVQNFLPTVPYEFNIDNISPMPSTAGNHRVMIDFYSGATLNYSDTFHYFLKGDNSLESSTGNILRILSGGIAYPHHISDPTTWSGNIDWSTILSSNPPGEEILSYFPVQDLSFQITPSPSGKVLTLRYHEYSYYDCLLGKHQIEEKIQKILLP